MQLTSDIDVLLNELIPRLTKRYRKTGRLTLLVFDDLISIADQLRVYSRFLATFRHYGVTTINMFQTYRGTHCWDGIKANCQTLVLFKTGLSSPTVISQVCNVNIGSSGNAKTKRDNWLYRLFTENVLNRGDYNHLLIDMRAQTGYSPTRFRSQTANLYTQRCYFDRGNKTDYDTFRTIRIPAKDPQERQFRMSAIIRNESANSAVVFGNNKCNGSTTVASGSSSSDGEDTVEEEKDPRKK